MGGVKVPAAGRNGTWESVFQQNSEALKAVTRAGFQRDDIVPRLKRGAQLLPVATILRSPGKKRRSPASGNRAPS